MRGCRHGTRRRAGLPGGVQDRPAPDARRRAAAVATGEQVAGDRYTAETLGRHLKSLRQGAERGARRPALLRPARLRLGRPPRAALPHRPAAHRRDPAAAAGDRLAGAASPGSFYRASARDPQGVAHAGAGSAVEQPVSSPASRTSTSTAASGHREPDHDRRDRTAPGRADARHRRHDPARAGRTGPRRARRSICVQGAPGTGKTAVGLHRAAYLLYTHRQRLSPHRRPGPRPEPGVPRLHLGRAAHAGRGRRRADDAWTTAGPRAASGLPTRRGRRRRQTRRPDGRRCCAGRSGRTGRRADRARWRPRRLLPLAGAGGGAPPAWSTRRAGGGAAVRRSAGSGSGPASSGCCSGRPRHAAESPSAVWPRRMGRSPPVDRFLDDGWPAVRPEELVAGCSATRPRWPGPRTASSPRPSRRRSCGRKPPRRPRRRGGRAADAVLVDEVAGPDRAAAELRARRRRRGAGPVRRCSAGPSPGAASTARSRCSATWPRAPRRGPPATGADHLAHLGKPDAAVVAADHRLPGAGGRRRAGQPAAAGARGGRAAGRVVPHRRRAPDLASDRPRRRATVAAVRAALEHEGSVAVIAADAAVEELRRRCGRAPGSPPRPPTTSAPPPASPSCRRRWPRAWSTTTWWWPSRPRSSTAEPRGLNRLYVVLTRAVSRLDVLHSGPLPAQILPPVEAGRTGT